MPVAAAPLTAIAGWGGPRPGGSRSLDSCMGRAGKPSPPPPPPEALLTRSVAARECPPLVDSVCEDQRSEPSQSPTGVSTGIASHSDDPQPPPTDPPSAQPAADDDAGKGEGVLPSALIEGGEAPTEEPCDPAAGDVGLSAGGSSALQPVASVSTDAIALRWFWLRFVNEEIEAM